MTTTAYWRGAWVALLLGSLLIAGYGIGFPWIAAAAPNPLVPLRPLLAVHAVAGGVALILGPFQFARWLRERRRKLHRNMGKAYLFACSVGGVTGLLLAGQSGAGPIAQSGFAALALAWLGSGVLGYRSARAGRFADHRAWMIRNFALTFAAVTLRVYLPLSMTAGADFLTAYQAIAWLCWVPNLLIAELIIRSGSTVHLRSTVPAAA